jgi:hypothetical protein
MCYYSLKRETLLAEVEADMEAARKDGAGRKIEALQLVQFQADPISR